MDRQILLLRRLHNLLIRNSNLLPCYFAPQIRFVHHHKELEEPGGYERFIGIKRSNTNRANRHTDMNERIFSRLRGQKRLVIDLEDGVERRKIDAMTNDQLRMYLLRRGKPNPYKEVSPREWREHQITIQSFGYVVDNYVPKQRKLTEKLREAQIKEIYEDTKDYLKHKFMDIKKFGLRRIRGKEGFQNFNLKDFVKEAENIYIMAFNALANRERQKLHQLITETAFANLWPDVEKGTLLWKFCNFIEPSQVANVRCIDMPIKSGNDIAQITICMRSKQKMAYYDKDGYLLLGSENETREVIEYNVFEMHIASDDGKWRFHGRVHPDWLEPKDRINRPSLIEDEELKERRPRRLHSTMAQHIEQSEKRRMEAETNKLSGSKASVINKKK